MLSVIILCTIFIILIIEIYSALKSFKIQNKENHTHIQYNHDNEENYNTDLVHISLPELYCQQTIFLNNDQFRDNVF